MINQLPLSFVFMLAILLCGCAPLCSSKRNAASRRLPIARPPLTNPNAGLSKDNTLRTHAGLRSGDIIFIAIPNPLFSHVSAATGCPATHVGIVFNDPAKGWVVAESAVPLSKITPLDKFIARSADGWCVIRRLKLGLTDAQVRALRTECDARMGVLYHPGFRYESDRLFCSKFVYDVYESALGIHVGELETFSELLHRRPESSLTFWKVWFFGRIPWNRITVTPASQFESARLKTVWQSAG